VFLGVGQGAEDQAAEPEGVEMSHHSNEEIAIVGRVRLALADGSEEVWLVPMRLTDDALSYHAVIYPPEGAVVLSVEPLKRPATYRKDLVIARADITLL
jgi:hypothetical protein